MTVPVGLSAVAGVRLADALERLAAGEGPLAALGAHATLLRSVSLGVGALAAVAGGWLALAAAATVVARRSA